MTIWLRSRVDLYLPTVADRVPDTVVKQGRVVLEVIQPESKGLTSATLHKVHEFWKRPLKCFCDPDWYLLHCLNLSKIASLGNDAD
mgnify:CR=1 FL=1